MTMAQQECVNQEEVGMASEEYFQNSVDDISRLCEEDRYWRENLQQSLDHVRDKLLSGQSKVEDPYSFDIVPEDDDNEESKDEESDSNDSSDNDQPASPLDPTDNEVGTNGSSKQTSTKVKKDGKKPKKRKKNSQLKRRNIKKILTDEQLDPQTLEAQMEERERLKRLELQNSLIKAKASSLSGKLPKSFQMPERESRTPSPVVVDATDKQGKDKCSSIVISDDEETSETNISKRIDEENDVIALLTSSDEVSESEKEEEEGDEYMDMHANDEFNVKMETGDVLVNVNHPADEPDIFIPPQIARAIQRHQIGGIRFLYDSLVESVKRANFSMGGGFGCILAHSMGLGKTVQTIAFIDVFLRHTSAKKVLCVVPINTILNWVNEFNLWVPEGDKAESASQKIDEKLGTSSEMPEKSFQEQLSEVSEAASEEKVSINESQDGSSIADSNKQVLCRNYGIYAITDAQKSTIARGKVIGTWHQKGGVLLIGYEMFRMISLYQPSMCNSVTTTKGKKKKQKEKKLPMTIDIDEEEREMQLMMGMQKAICRPGPDLVVCDEGHRIKNFHSNISQALHKIKTRRRLVLTGYPMQNNLIEYWCMVDFVRPNYLGTRTEFSNMFERPIMNGQCIDSTPADKKLMRYRAHVLNSLLKGFVQRRDHGVLKKVLPPKFEHVFMVRLSDAQQKLYRRFVTLCHEVHSDSTNPIRLFAICCKIWNHPDILHTAMLEQTGENPEVLLDTDEDLGGLNGAANKKKANEERSACMGFGTTNDQDAKALLNSVKHWATEVYSAINYSAGILGNSGKMVLLMEIINETLAQGDRMLLFSQSLLTLDLIEKFLSKVPVPCYEALQGMEFGSERFWTKNRDYYRIDGRTMSSERERLINSFNDPRCDAKLFLLSTRAGCLGVNLTGANRVVIFDVSWNPCHDAQAVCRVYRYGQFKPCHIYRLVASNTMEQRMYYRQISKQGISDRVVDELNPGENFTKDEIQKLISAVWDDEPERDFTDAVRDSEDPVMKKVLTNCASWVVKPPFQHETLLEDQIRNRLSRTEKKMARLAYEQEKRNVSGFNIYDGSYARNRPDMRPVVTVPPFIQTQSSSVLQQHVSTFDRLALVNSYLRQVYVMNKSAQQTGVTFSSNVLNSNAPGAANFASCINSEFTATSSSTLWSITSPAVDGISSFTQSVASYGSREDTAVLGGSTVHRVGGYEPYQPLTSHLFSVSSANQGQADETSDSLDVQSGSYLTVGQLPRHPIASLQTLNDVLPTRSNFPSSCAMRQETSVSTNQNKENSDVIVIDLDD